MSRNVSASSLERAIECPASAYLPQANSTSRWADRGNLVDGFVRAVLTGTPAAQALCTIEDKEARALCSRIDFAGLGGDLHDVRCQVAYFLDPVARSAREIGVNIGRDYERYRLNENELPGTDDIGGTGFTDLPVELDVKAGYLPVTPCEDNAQMKYCCAARMLVTGAPEVEGRIARIRQNGSVWLDRHVFTRFDIDLFLDDVEEAMGRIQNERRIYLATGEVSVTTGDWCRHCHAMANCPNYTALARTMVTDLTDIGRRVSELTLDQAGAAWAKASQAETLLKRIFSALEARAKQEWLPSQPGSVVRPVSYEKESFSQSAALDLLKAHGATEEEIDSLYKTVLIESVRETKDPNAPKQAKVRKPRKIKAA